MRKCRTASQEAAKFMAAKIRHYRIGYDNIYRRGQHHLHRFKAIRGGEDLVTGALKHNLKKAPQSPIVFSQQDRGLPVIFSW